MALNTYRKTWKQIQVHNSAESWFKDQREAQPTWITKIIPNSLYVKKTIIKFVPAE